MMIKALVYYTRALLILDKTWNTLRTLLCLKNPYINPTYTA